MKKLTNTQIKKLRELLLTKAGEVNQSYGVNALYYVENFMRGDRVWYRRPGSRGKRSTTIAAVYVAREVVEAMGYTITSGNSAPRGGELGDYFVKTGRSVKFNADELIAVLKG